MASLALCLILIVSLIGIVECGILRLDSSDDHLISDGTGNLLSCCPHQYGFLPCAENPLGYAFLAVVYQLLLIVGDMLIGSGSEMLFYIIGHRYGGILFRILRVLPSMALLIFSGILSDKERAQSQVSVGVGICTGTTVFSLTLKWFMCMVSSRKSFMEEPEVITSRSIFTKIREGLRILRDNGVEVDEGTCQTAKIMLFSLIPYVLLELVYAFDNTSSGKPTITLIALLVSTVSLISYFAYQIWNPWMQKRSLDVVNDMMFKTEQDKMITEEEFINGLTKWCDEAKKSDSSNEIPNPWMQTRSSDVENDIFNVLITEEEFINGFKKWSNDAKKSEDRRSIELSRRNLDSDGDGSLSGGELKRVIDDDAMIKKVLSLFEQDENDEEMRKGVKVNLQEIVKDKRRLSKSVIKVLAGTVMVTFMAGPLMANIINLSNAITKDTSNFAISFVAVPLAMNLKVPVAAAFFPPTPKKENTASLTFSEVEIYSGVIVNNMVGWTTLLAVVYAKDLTWGFSPQVLAIMFVCAAVGSHAARSKVYRLWTCIPIFFIYFSSAVYCFSFFRFS